MASLPWQAAQCKAGRPRAPPGRFGSSPGAARSAPTAASDPAATAACTAPKPLSATALTSMLGQAAMALTVSAWPRIAASMRGGIPPAALAPLSVPG